MARLPPAIALIALAILALSALPVEAQAAGGLVYEVTAYQAVTVDVGGRVSVLPVFYARYIVALDGQDGPRVTVLIQESITGAGDYRRILQAFNPGPSITVGPETLPEPVYYVVDGYRLPYKCSQAIRLDSRIGAYYYTPDGILVYAAVDGLNPLSEALIYSRLPPGTVKDIQSEITVRLVKAGEPVCGAPTGSTGTLAALGALSAATALGAVYSFAAWRNKLGAEWIQDYM